MTRAFNFSDLPCPPPEIAQQLDPGAAYNPLVIIPTSWGMPWEIANETLNCELEAIKDPPSSHTAIGHINRATVGPPH